MLKKLFECFYITTHACADNTGRRENTNAVTTTGASVNQPPYLNIASIT